MTRLGAQAPSFFICDVGRETKKKITLLFSFLRNHAFLFPSRGANMGSAGTHIKKPARPHGDAPITSLRCYVTTRLLSCSRKCRDVLGFCLETRVRLLPLLST